jgi:hypothetical protein
MVVLTVASQLYVMWLLITSIVSWNHVCSYRTPRRTLPQLEKYNFPGDGRLGLGLRGYHPVAPRLISCRFSVHRLCSSTRHLQRCSTPSNERRMLVKDGIMGEKWPTNFAVIWGVPHQMKGSLTCHRSVTWDRWLYFPSEGSRAEDFFALKTRRLWPGLIPWSWVPEASVLTTRPPKLLYFPGERANHWPGRCNRMKRTMTLLPSCGHFRK